MDELVARTSGTEVLDAVLFDVAHQMAEGDVVLNQPLIVRIFDFVRNNYKRMFASFFCYLKYFFNSSAFFDPCQSNYPLVITVF